VARTLLWLSFSQQYTDAAVFGGIEHAVDFSRLHDYEVAGAEIMVLALHHNRTCSLEEEQFECVWV
jgi:hypothetical protein